MTDYPYDPELPHVVARIKQDERSYPVGILARFKNKSDAEEMAEGYMEGWVELVDTTPKPKIPAYAEFIFWLDEGWNSPWYGRQLEPGYWELDNGETLGTPELEDKIGDAEVVVLKRA